VRNSVIAGLLCQLN